MTNLDVLMMAFLSILGALMSATLGWLKSGEPFDARKFTSSILMAIIAGIVAALRFSTLETITVWDYFIAILMGAGLDVFGNRTAGAIASKKQATTASPTATSA